jgi:hypothetical protein
MPVFCTVGSGFLSPIHRFTYSVALHREGKNKTDRITVKTIPAVEKAQSVAEEKELLQSLLKFL